MSLRLKAFIAIVAVVVAGTALLCAVLWRLSAESFTNVETDLLTRDAERAHAVVQADLAALTATAVDWAQWDDTYAFLEPTATPTDSDVLGVVDTEESAYVESNIVESTFSQNGLSAMAFVSKDGATRYAGTYDPSTGSIQASLSDPLTTFAATAAGAVAAAGTDAAASTTGGILADGDGGVWEAVAVPVVRSDGSGPANGIILMARTLGPAALRRLGDTVRLPLALDRIDSIDASRPELSGLAADPPRFAVVLDDVDTAHGFATLATLNGPPLLLTFGQTRSMAALNESQQTRLAVLLVVMGTVLALMMIVVTDRFVLARLVDVSRTVEHVAESGDVSTRVPTMGNDEIGRLASGTNTMLVRIEAVTAALETARSDAEAGSRAKSEFLANMSHELRTPLHAILGMSRLAAETEGRDERDEMLSSVEDAATTLLEMVDDVLVLSQEEAGKLELNPAPFSPAALAGDLAATARAKATPGVEIDVSVGAGVAPILVGDVDRIRHCVGNLVANAVKFTTTGSIAVSLDCDTGDDRGCLVFVVVDTGVGIPPDRLAAVLGAFEQADMSSTRRHGGTGLGVTVAARLARRMGGRLSLASEPGLGTTATVEVPVSVPEADPVHSPTHTPPCGGAEGSVTGSLRVLVVEDNPVNQRVACRMLAKLGHRAEVVDDGAQAVPLVVSGNFDAVLMDVQMPVMDGLTATRHIRSAEEGEVERRSRVPIVALTAHAMAGDRERCLEAGMDAYVTKPFNAETLARTLANVTGGSVTPGARS